MKCYDTTLFCHDLPTTPQRMGTILVTGATGYIGGRLVDELVARGYDVRVMVRTPSSEHAQRWPGAKIVLGDALSPPCMRDALKGVHTAYYLIHSLMLGPDEFEPIDTLAAVNFRQAAKSCQVRQIIYLGGLGDSRDALSPHLRSRIEVARELEGGPIPVTILRAATIIGSGSAAFEIIKSLVIQAPLLILPRWIDTRCQPVSIRDVVKYLVGVLETPETSGKSFDIGGPDILTYRQMIETTCHVLEKKRHLIKTPLSNVKVFSYLASLITPVPAPITRCLVEGIANEVICRENNIRDMIPFEPLSFKEALLRAVAREKHHQVTTRWSDAYPRDHTFAVKLHQLPEVPRYIKTCSLVSSKNSGSLFFSLCRIGGDQGWFNTNWMWSLRGMIDKLLMGIGISRGRKNTVELRVNDVIDFWRVESIENNKSLLLRAEMKLPGLAWLEFTITPEKSLNRLTVMAYFEPRGFTGKVYWHLFIPFHHFIFKDLIEEIEKHCR